MSYIDGAHIQVALCITNACVELIGTLPQNDAVSEMHDLLIDQFDILKCCLDGRHFGSDQLDGAVSQCVAIIEQVKQIEDR